MPGPITTKDLRTWCRNKYGLEWWKSDDKPARLAEARVALGGVSAPRAAQNPLKPVYHWYEGDPDSYGVHLEDRFYKLKASACIKGEFLQASKNLKNHKRPPYWGIHWRGPCNDHPDGDRHGLPWVGTDFCEWAYDGEHHYGPTFADYGDSAEEVAEKLLALKDGLGTYSCYDPYAGYIEFPIRDDVMSICRDVWLELSPATRERLLRDSFAETIYINEEA